MIVAFTGHRPSKLPGGYDIFSNKNKELAKKIMIKLKAIIKDKKDVEIITGGAIGVDQMAFTLGYTLRKKNQSIKLTMAIPFVQQYARWAESDVNRYMAHIAASDSVVFVDELDKYKDKSVKTGVYSAKKMQLRNMYIVDRCDVLIAIWDRKPSGGTYNAISYAKKNNKQIIYIDL